MSVALPRLDGQAAAATRAAVATGLNGVDPTVRSHALRKIRAAVRRGTLSPEAVGRAVEGGDAGLASLFPVDQLPPVPALSADAASVSGGCCDISRMVVESRWFIELAFRRKCAPDGLLDALGSPSAAAGRTASLLLQAWNNLLASYRPAWLPENVVGERPHLIAVPASLINGDQVWCHPTADGLVHIEAGSISRLFVDTDVPDFAVLLHALKKLDKACVYPIMAFDPVLGRACYSDYAHGEFGEDLMAHLTWPEGAAEPVADLEAVAMLAENFGYEPDEAAHYAAGAIAEAVLNRRFEAEPSTEEIERALSSGDGPSVIAARKILSLADNLSKLPVSARKLTHDISGVGLPVHLVATCDDDPLHSDLMQAIDMECQEDMPSIQLYREGLSMPELDRQMARLVVEMLVAEYTYALVLDAC